VPVEKTMKYLALTASHATVLIRLSAGNLVELMAEEIP
jgi:hypothetical protein